MPYEPDLDPAPSGFRELFAGQALMHLDEIVMSWRMAGHPIEWAESFAIFQVHLTDGLAPLFRLHAPEEGIQANVEVNPSDSGNAGIPGDLVRRLWQELADIGRVVENEHVPLAVNLGRFSRGDRKVFLAYALTIARTIARPPLE